MRIWLAQGFKTASLLDERAVFRFAWAGGGFVRGGNVKISYLLDLCPGFD